LLLGQPEFRFNLASHPGLEQLRQRVIARHHLEAMEEAELKSYVEHRLGCVGWAGNPAFDEAVFAEIHRASDGIPRRVNQIVNRLLLLGAIEQRGSIDQAMVQQVLADLDEDAAVTEPAAAFAEAPIAPALPAEPAVQSAPIAAETGMIRAALADRDSQITELQQALIELANTVEGPVTADAAAHAQEIAALRQQVSVLEKRLGEQEQTLRHTLTMLIEWIEADDLHRVAA
jgi:hypothetical protein